MLYMLSIQDIKDFIKMILACFFCRSSCVMGNKEETGDVSTNETKYP